MARESRCSAAHASPQRDDVPQNGLLNYTRTHARAFAHGVTPGGDPPGCWRRVLRRVRSCNPPASGRRGSPTGSRRRWPRSSRSVSAGTARSVHRIRSTRSTRDFASSRVTRFSLRDDPSRLNESASRSGRDICRGLYDIAVGSAGCRRWIRRSSAPACRPGGSSLALDSAVMTCVGQFAALSPDRGDARTPALRHLPPGA